jgi:hypothetical protein
MSSRVPAKSRAALERLIQVAQGDTGQSRIVANFLLAWWNAEECGGFDPTGVWGVDTEIALDMPRVFALIAGCHQYPDTMGYGNAVRGHRSRVASEPCCSGRAWITAMIEDSMTVRITEAELARDVRAVLAQVEQGSEVIIEQEDHRPVAVIRAPNRSGSQIMRDSFRARNALRGSFGRVTGRHGASAIGLFGNTPTRGFIL